MSNNKNTTIPVSADAMRKFNEIRKSNKPQLEKDIEIIALFDEVELDYYSKLKQPQHNLQQSNKLEIHI